MSARVTIVNPRRERAHRRGGPPRYLATILVNGEPVGTVQRGWTMGGAYGDQYAAHADGLIVATGYTLADLRVELADWAATR